MSRAAVDVGGDRMPPLTAPARMAAKMSGIPPKRDHRESFEVQAKLLQRRAHGEIAGRAETGDADFLAFEIGALSDARIGDQGENHLVRGRADPDKVGALCPSGHHGRRRKMAKLDFAGEKACTAVVPPRM